MRILSAREMRPSRACATSPGWQAAQDTFPAKASLSRWATRLWSSESSMSVSTMMSALRSISSVVLDSQSCLTLYNPMDCSLPGSCVHGILQARILEWVVIFFFRGSSQPRDRTRVF